MKIQKQLPSLGPSALKSPKPAPEPPPGPQDGFVKRATQEVALSSTATALAGGVIAYVATRNPANLVHNLMGGMVAGSLLGPAVAAARMSHDKVGSRAELERVANSGLNGTFVGAASGALVSLGLSFAMPESAAFHLIALASTVGGGVAGATLFAHLSARSA